MDRAVKSGVGNAPVVNAKAWHQICPQNAWRQSEQKDHTNPDASVHFGRREIRIVEYQSPWANV